MATGGNSADDLRFACLAALNDDRSSDLAWVSVRTISDYPIYVKASNIGATLDPCFNNNSTHVEQSECVRELADNSDTELESAEAIVSNKLSKTGNDDPIKYDPLFPLKNKFYSGSDSFERYREEEGKFYAAMAMGGNGAHDLRSACLASLNAKRSERLKWIVILR
jgi:hypothetical protein